LAAGSYTVVVSDINSCTAITKAVIIANPTVITVTAVGSPQTSCFGASDGIITVSASGGTGVYSYTLNDGEPHSSNIFEGLPAGKYFVTVRDINGCSATTEVIIIPDPELLKASAKGSSQVSCTDVRDGVITVTAEGGTGAYTYSLNGDTPQTSNVFEGLAAGTYTVVVRDANGCSATTQAVVIENPPLLTIFVKSSPQVSCNGASDGTIIAVASGGTGAYLYTINNGEPQSSNIFSNLPAGTYVVAVRDINGCSATSKEIIILDPEVLIATIEGASQVTCNGDADGVVNVVAYGGTPPYSYSLNGGTFQSIGTFDGLYSGTYSVVVRDAYSCTYTTEPVEIINPRKLALEAHGSDPSCNNSSDGQIIVNATGGTGNYMYALNDGEFQSSNIFSHLSSGIYIVKVRDSNGCTSLTETSIKNPGEIIVSASGTSSVSCNGVSDGRITISAEGGTGHFTYSINGIDFQESNVFTDLAPGGYNITVLDANGCMGKISYSISSKDPIVISILSNLNAECHGFTGGSAEVGASGGTPPYKYEWSNGASGAAASGLKGGSYIITVSDGNNCEMTKSITIGLNNYVEISPSNVFTPNEDGINDRWTVKNIELYPDNELVIINRWGNEVYTTKGYNNEWNGSQLNEGTYFYVLKANMCGEERKYSGFITIIK
jgi:gliding motility-associated-like protein